MLATLIGMISNIFHVLTFINCVDIIDFNMLLQFDIC